MSDMRGKTEMRQFMTKDEAIWILTRVEAHGLAAEARDMAILALKRDTRKDLPMMVTDRTCKCPACHADNFYTMYDMQDDSHYNYCAYCGQRLDWTEDNKRRGIKNDYQ